MQALGQSYDNWKCTPPDFFEVEHEGWCEECEEMYIHIDHWCVDCGEPFCKAIKYEPLHEDEPDDKCENCYHNYGQHVI